MSENKQVYLKEEEVEHVIAALSGNTSARDLAEAIGRSEDEVLAVIQEMRSGQEPTSEIDLLREQNQLLQKQIEELKGRRTLTGRQRIRLAAAVGACFMLALGCWTMFVMNRSVPAQATAPVAPSFADTTVPAGIPVPDSAVAETPATPPPSEGVARASGS